MTRTYALRQYTLAALVALGLAGAWCIVIVWLVSIAETAAARRSTYEQPYFRHDGEVVIMRYPQGVNASNQEVVDLSGQVVKTDAAALLTTQFINRPGQVPVEGGLSWRTRLTGVNDGATPLTYWYLVHDGRVNGSAYGVGYHSLTKQVAGYFGRQGFTAVRPPRSDWFNVPGDYGLSLATSVLINTEPTWATENVLYLLADGKLWSIDPRKKRVQAITDAPQGATIGWIWDSRKAKKLDDPAVLAVQGNNWAPRMLVMRTDAALTLVDPQQGKRATIPLPPELQGEMLAGAECPGGDLMLLSYSGWMRQGAKAAIRLGPEGQVVSRQAIRLSPYGSDVIGEANTSWLSLGAAPFPLGQIPLVFAMPQNSVQIGEADSYAAAFVPNLLRSWPGLLGAAIIGAISALAAYRRQRRFALPDAIGWAIFAFLFGAPGWIAYRWHRPWPVVEECPACAQPAPRDRNACTECGAAFPPPELKGLEVFA